ncbi:MAG: DUF1573 domain-containing protein [candidate division Zixibacteria bacterium]|nr:DUF1573 domain-containing protein [candidate division Zixibacteria bacterium]
MIYTAGNPGRTTQKSARVTTNDTTLGKVSISFRAEAKEPTDSVLKLTADPPILDFGTPEDKKRRKLESKIENMTDEEMELSIVSVPPEFFKKVELDDSKLKPGKRTELKVELEKGREDEQFRKSITLEAVSKDKKKFRLTLPVLKGIGGSATAKKGKN